MTATTTPTSLWRSPRYLIWLASDTSKGLAAALFGFAVPLLALIVTDDPAQAGIIGGAGMVAKVVFTLAGGVLADRHARTDLMIIGSLLGVLLAGAFTVLALADALTFLSLLVANVLLAARSGIFDVAGESAIKQIVPDDAMGRAQAANQGRDAALQLAGGPLGGLLLSVGGWAVGAVMTLCQLVAGATAWMLRRGEPAASAPPACDDDEDTEPADAANAWGELREGFAWLLSRPDLGGVLLTVTVINLGFNAAITTVIYALQQDGHSELLIGTLGAAVGAIMLGGALIAPLLVPRFGAGAIAIAGLSTATVGTVVLCAVDQPWGIVAVLGAAVLLLPALNAGMMGYFMVATPSRLLGRANSAAGVLAMGALPLAPLVAGFGLAWLGREGTLLVCAGLCLASVSLAVANRALRALPVESKWAEHAKRYEST
ncbi:MFS transporter [Microbacterium sp. 1.5R]|uniref:MFS transporter n=1 Tax=Microbacterium sp. 1.5R TaxID=1916917 RepID=UPI0011A75682|nr:MFS transporter [Microbacterium sp. 1.5R]